MYTQKQSLIKNGKVILYFIIKPQHVPNSKKSGKSTAK